MTAIKSTLETVGLCGVLCISLAGLASVPPANADMCTWDGSDGNWNDTARWSCGHEPGAGDSATVNGGGVFVTVAATVDSLTLTGGSLRGNADLEITVMFQWSGGTMEDTGKTTVAQNATMMISGSSNKTLHRVLDNAGTANWSGTGTILSNTGTFANLLTGALTLQSDARIGSGGNSSFINDGSIIKTGGSGESRFNMVFTQSSTGSMQALDGILRFSQSSTIDGSITANGATILITAGTVTFVATASLTAANFIASGGDTILELGGAGFTVTNVTISDDLFFSGPAVSFPNLTLTDGSLQGTGDVEVTGLLDWSGGTMLGAGKTIISQSAALTVSGSSNKTLHRVLDNAGTATWSGTGPLRSNTGTFANLSTGTLTLQNDEQFGNGSSSSFINDGSIIKTGGSGESRFNTVFTQSSTGSVEVQDGTFRFSQDSSFAGELTASGTTVLFTNGDATFSDDVDFQVTNLEISDVFGSVDMSNITDLTLVNVFQSGGTFTLNHPAGLVQGDFVHTGGTFVHGKGRLIFGSGGEQNLSLSDPTEFFLLEVAPGTTLVETDASDNATIAGFLKNRGTIRKTQGIPAVGNVTFGLTDIELDIVDPGTLMSLQVDRVGTTHPSAVPPTIREQYWELTPTGNSFEVDLTVNHCFQPQSELRLCQFTTPNWSCENQMSSPTSITQVGVTQFVDTALGSDEYHSMTSFECGNVSAWSDVRGLC